MPVKNLDELLSRAKQVRDEQRDRANSANRVGTLFEDIIDSLTAGEIISALSRYFLRKDKGDSASELITFLKGLAVAENGSGIFVEDDGTTTAVVDRLYVKLLARFEALEIKKKSHVGGAMMLTSAGMKCSAVKEFDDYYRCYIKQEEGEYLLDDIYNEFSIGHLAFMKECNLKKGIGGHVGSRYFWREVVGVGVDYIDVSKLPDKCDPSASNDMPAVGDDIIGLGHRTDVTRQAAIVLDTVDEGAPSIIFYQGINDFTLKDKEVICMDFDKATGHARLKVYGELYVGDRPDADKKAKNYMKYTPEEGLKVKGSLIVENEKGEDEELTQKMLQDILNAQKRLDSWIADGFISPLEKKELKDEIVRITADKDYIVKSYTTYNLGSPTALIKAYNAYKKMLTDLSAPEPECIPVPDNFKTVMENFYTQKRLAMEQINSTISSNFSTLDNKLSFEITSRQQADEDNSSETVTLFTAVNGKIEGVIARVDTIDGEVTATETRLTQTEDSITAQATKISEQGDFLSALSVKVDGISSIVTTANSTATSAKDLADKANALADSAVTDASNALNQAGLAIGGMEDALNAANEAKDSAATAIQQSSSAVSIIAAKFNADGSLKNTSGLVVTSEFSALQTRMGEAEAIISTCVTTDEYGNLVGTVYIRGDQVKFDAGTYTINADHINFESGTYTISADHIDLSGYVSVSLKTGDSGERTVIKGNRIQSWNYHYLDSEWTTIQGDAVEINNASYNAKISPHEAYFARSGYGAGFGVDSDGYIRIRAGKWPRDAQARQNELYLDKNLFLRVRA